MDPGRWLDTLRAASPVALPDPLWRDLAQAYTAPGRHYHTLEHLVELAGWYRAVGEGPGWRAPRAVWLALLFHDVVYGAAAPRGRNEAESAAALLAALPGEDAAARLIGLTATHGAGGDVEDPDAAHFLDADLAILGAEPDRFARYEAQVEAEYAPAVGVEAYRAGRRAFLAAMAATPRLYRTPFFRERLEGRARENLARALAGPASPVRP